MKAFTSSRGDPPALSCCMTLQRSWGSLSFKNSTCWFKQGSRVLARSSLLSRRTHLSFLFWPGKTLQWLRHNVRGHVVGWGDSWRPMGKPLVWGPRASRESRRGGPEWVGKVNGKGLLQVSFSYYHLKRDPSTGWWAKRRRRTGEEAGLICCAGQQVKKKHKFESWQRNKDKRKRGCWHTANVLLEFMHKSNNTKRNERWGNWGK